MCPGSRLGVYEILSALGKGGMGEVYRANDPRLRREVAIKVLSPDAARNPDRQRRFEREARAASGLNHPNILTVYEFGHQDGSPYIVMELVDGESLRDHLRRGPVSARKLLDIATQIADGLAAAHQAHITHRDLKPENIMLTRDGRVKILDFGLALRAMPAIGADDITLTMAQTKPGILLGTIHYMSPEQTRGVEVDYRSDQFSLGVILYEIAAGARPFDRPSVAESLQAILSEDPPPIPERAAVSIPVRWIIARLLAKEPAERYASTADLYRDLRTHRDHALVGIPEPIQRQSRRRRINYAAAALLIIIAAILGAMLTRSGPNVASYRYTPFALDAGMDAAPAWSPDGKTIAYLHEIDGIAQVLARGVEASVPTQITKSSDPCSLLFWAPDGNRLFYISARKLLSVSAAGGQPELVLDDVNLAAAISPDGKTLAFGKSGAGGKLWLHSLIDRKTVEYPAPLEGQSQNRQVRFSPDGKKIGALWPSQKEHTLDNTFWILPNPPGPKVRSITLDASSFSWMPGSRYLVAAKNSANAAGQHLYWVDTESGKSEALTAGLGSETGADASPDGSRIAFTNGGVDSDLIEVPLDNSPVKTLLSTSRNETNPSWSPDGSQFAYVQDAVGRGTEIWLRSVNGAWSRPLIRSASAAVTFTNPRFSPDGQRIVYESWSPEGYRLWVTTVGGGNPVRLTLERNHQHSPAWSPDGDWIAYRANVGDERLIEKIPSGGGHPVTLARATTAFFLVWSPTGEWLCYVDTQSIQLVATDGSQHRKLVDRASNAFGFSGDGRKLYFVAAAGSKSALWSIEIASSKMRMERMLDTSAAAIRGFSLHPDGNRFATSVAVSHEDIWILDGFERPGRLFSLRPWYANALMTAR